MATGSLLGTAIVFCFLGLFLVCLGFATDHWIRVTVDREALRAISSDPLISLRFTNDPNYFTRHRGIFKVCYSGNETAFLENDDLDLVSGNCLWITGLTFDSEEGTTSFEDEYEARNHLIRAHLSFFVIGIVGLLIGLILASVGCWRMSARGFRLAGLLVFVGAFFIALGMACFHIYDYFEREEINQEQQGLFPRFWEDLPELDGLANFSYSWSYILAWIGLGFSAISAVLLLCTAASVTNKDNYENFFLHGLRHRRFKGAGPFVNPAPQYQQQIIYEQAPPQPRQVIEVPVEVEVPVPVEPPAIIPVIDGNYGGYGGGGYSAYGGGGYNPEVPAILGSGQFGKGGFY